MAVCNNILVTVVLVAFSLEVILCSTSSSVVDRYKFLLRREHGIGVVGDEVTLLSPVPKKEGRLKALSHLPSKTERPLIKIIHQNNCHECSSC